MLVENAVKLGKTVESAGERYLCNGGAGVDEQGLHIAHPRHLNIVCQGKAGNILKLVREVAAADGEFICQHIQ